jgi:hypothetical protein
MFVDVGRVSPLISSPGDIRREYELHLHKFEEEARKKLEMERRASEDLIRKIQVSSLLFKEPQRNKMKCHVSEQNSTMTINN